MKGKCIGLDGEDYIIRLFAGSLTVGNDYTMEDAARGTAAQNRAFHALLTAFWHWMHRTDNFVFEDCGRIYDLSTPDPDKFKRFFKYKYGAGADHYQYVNDNMEMVEVKIFEEIPAHVMQDQKEGRPARIKVVEKSWSDYTKKQRQEAIDTLLRIIDFSGCDDKKVSEIRGGMENDNKN